MSQGLITTGSAKIAEVQDIITMKAGLGTTATMMVEDTTNA